jgi:predicted dehydrogenase/threonine dehydrogenase-like Zn-dependent dehydrogenase
MKQVLQDLKSGATEVVEVPCPISRAGHLLIQTRASLISAGTERTIVEFGKSSLIAKARSQPDKVRQVLDKIKTDGIMPTLDAVFSRLNEPLPLGYCNAGVVVDVGAGVQGFSVGDRVISNGSHAEIVSIPKNLCAKIPDNVCDEDAAFTVLASIALQGVRLVQPSLGEVVVVSGLGLVGLITVQLLLASGCRVVGIDPDSSRCELAKRYGATVVNLSSGGDPVATALAASDGRGVDAVLITASSKSNEIIKQSAHMCRKRGRIVLVGVVGLELSRADFYEKELTFQVSCSYGPGRYDDAYEQRGQDYPFGFVRWTEQRNFDAILDQLASGRLDVSSMVTERIPHHNASEAYKALTDSRDALGIVLTYPTDEIPREKSITIQTSQKTAPVEKMVVGVIGAGNFARMVGIPAIAKTGVQLSTVANRNGTLAGHAARKFGFRRATTDSAEIMNDPSINTVFIFTRHDLHAQFVNEALESGKNVFVEKPLCLTLEDLAKVRQSLEKATDKQLLVGFNRRFAPHTQRIKRLLDGRTEPVCMSMMINAGVIPADFWVHDPDIGGGRIIGEGCHWIDLMSYIAGSPVTRVHATEIGEAPGLAVRDDKMTITICLADGSMGTLHYFGNGHKSYQKETLEVFSNGRVLRLDNFRTLRGYGWPGFKKMKLMRMDKGHNAEFARFVSSVSNGESPVIPFEQIENITRATIAAVASARDTIPIDIT